VSGLRPVRCVSLSSWRPGNPLISICECNSFHNRAASFSKEEMRWIDLATLHLQRRPVIWSNKDVLSTRIRCAMTQGACSTTVSWSPSKLRAVIPPGWGLMRIRVAVRLSYCFSTHSERLIPNGQSVFPGSEWKSLTQGMLRIVSPMFVLLVEVPGGCEIVDKKLCSAAR
jgi:hypothetical protein